MTVRDVLVQIGFLMVTGGAMLLAWAVLTGQFSRAGPEAIPPEPAEDLPDEPEDFVVPTVRRGASPRPRPKAAKPRATGSKPRTAKPRPRKPRPPA